MTTDPTRLALSIRQPWVELILLGRKSIEVRSWTTKHRGPLWLHAGMARERKLFQRIHLDEKQLAFGALVGRCELTDCMAFAPATWEQWRGRHHNPGPLTGTLYAWLLENPARIPPIPMRGKLGLMRVQPELCGCPA
ncbi:ASCH domain-containing protein [Desulfonatronum thiodismutans]|uniref:ASCH domain-containing protein n=1 Tax=Desulfonatronum thiodismutans TaxID=159290 RepID=UPI0004ABDBF2|nr:ASCH domain-containing protein [Desulfonatronum thiodismutans]